MKGLLFLYQSIRYDDQSLQFGVKNDLTKQKLWRSYFYLVLLQLPEQLLVLKC